MTKPFTIMKLPFESGNFLVIALPIQSIVMLFCLEHSLSLSRVCNHSLSGTFLHGK
jgi:hypothetical protein